MKKLLLRITLYSMSVAAVLLSSTATFAFIGCPDKPVLCYKGGEEKIGGFKAGTCSNNPVRKETLVRAGFGICAWCSEEDYQKNVKLCQEKHGEDFNVAKLLGKP